MSEEPYSKREIDSMHSGIHEKLDDILTKVTFTNGKVKKIVIALILVFGIIIGQTFEPAEIVKTLLALAV